jgi:hypothetical protein
VSGFQGVLSSRLKSIVPLKMETDDSSFEAVPLKRMKSKKRFSNAVKSVILHKDLDKINKLKSVSDLMFKRFF